MELQFVHGDFGRRLPNGAGGQVRVASTCKLHEILRSIHDGGWSGDKNCGEVGEEEAGGCDVVDGERGDENVEGAVGGGADTKIVRHLRHHHILVNCARHFHLLCVTPPHVHVFQTKIQRASQNGNRWCWGD